MILLKYLTDFTYDVTGLFILGSDLQKHKFTNKLLMFMTTTYI